MATIVYGIHIEGIGPETYDANVTNGTMWCTSQGADIADGTHGYTWEPYLVESFPSTDTTAEPFSARISFSSFDFELHGKDQVAERFFYQQAKGDAKLSTAIDDDDTSMTLDTDAYNAGDIVFMGNETIHIGTDGGGGSYSSLDRGFYGSSGEHHPADRNVYGSQPFWKDRRVVFYTLDISDPTATPVARWRGRLDGAISTTEDGSRLVLKCKEQLGGITRAKINRDPQRLSGHSFQYEPNNSVSEDAVSPQGTYDARETRVRKVFSGKRQWWQIDNQLVLATGGALTRYDALKSISMQDAPDKGPVDVDAIEVFCIDRELDASVSGNSFSSTRELANTTKNNSEVYPYHPLAIFGAMWLSTRSLTSTPDNFDVLLAPNWSMDAKGLFHEDIVTDLHNLIQKTYYYQVDRLLLGWDGEPVNIFEVSIKKLLHPFGFYLGVDGNGKLTISEVKLVDVDDYDAARDNQIAAIPTLLNLSNGQESATDVISATLGGLPWEKADNLIIRAVDGEGDRQAAYHGESDIEFDFSTTDPDHVAVVQTWMAQRALMQHFAIPRLRIKVNDWEPDGLDYGIGQSVTLADLPLENAWLVDKSGTRVKTLNSAVEFTGYIVGRQYLPDEANAYILDILVIGDALVREIAPSGLVSSVDSGTKTISFGASSNFGRTESDAHYFTAGDSIQARTPNGALRTSEIAVVDSVDSGAGDIVLTTWPFTTDPQSGDIIEVAPLDSDEAGGTAGYWNTAVATYVDRVYAFLADTAETLGDQGLTADQYGA